MGEAGGRLERNRPEHRACRGAQLIEQGLTTAERTGRVAARVLGVQAAGEEGEGSRRCSEGVGGGGKKHSLQVESCAN
jgi:hypothetical protein